jgi:NADH-quinone oxidoreductase subunit K
MTFEFNFLYFLGVGGFIFLIGVLGITLNKKNILIILMSIELILLSVNLNFIVFSVLLDDILGQIYVVYVLTLAAAESAIGLAILVSYYKIRGSIAIENVRTMKG